MSRQLDSLLKGLDRFSAGMDRYAQNKAIGEATTQAEALATNAELDAEERVNQLDMLATNLRLKLMGAGASAAVAETAGASIGMTPYQRATIEANQATQAAKSARTTAASESKAQQQLTDLKIGAQKDFPTVYKNVPDLQKSIDQAEMASDILSSNNPIGDTAIGTFMARATGEVGNLTEAEREVFRSSPALKARFDQLVTTWKSGRLSDENKRSIMDLARTMGEASKRQLARQARDFATSRAKAIGGDVTPASILELVSPQSARYIQSKKDALRDLNIMLNDPKYKSQRQLILQKIAEAKAVVGE